MPAPASPRRVTRPRVARRRTLPSGAEVLAGLVVSGLCRPTRKARSRVRRPVRGRGRPAGWRGARGDGASPPRTPMLVADSDGGRRAYADRQPTSVVWTTRRSRRLMRTPPVPRDRARSRPASCRAISAQEAEQRTGSETCRRRPPRSATSSAARAARAAHVDRGRRPHDAAQPTPSRSPAPSSPGSSAERCRSDLGPHHDGRPYVSCGVAAIRPLPRSQLEHLPAAGRETRNADARTQRPPGCRTTNRATRT